MTLPPSGSQVDINSIRNEINAAGGSVINRIQRGVTTSPFTGNVTITSINTAKSFVQWNSFDNGTGVDKKIVITGPTTINITGSAIAGWEVIEFS